MNVSATIITNLDGDFSPTQIFEVDNLNKARELGAVLIKNGFWVMNKDQTKEVFFGPEKVVNVEIELDAENEDDV